MPSIAKLTSGIILAAGIATGSVALSPASVATPVGVSTHIAYKSTALTVAEEELIGPFLNEEYCQIARKFWDGQTGDCFDPSMFLDAWYFIAY
jgi:hypothetical protein